MAINIVNTTNEEKNFNFLTNQSSILHTSDTNNITVNGVNVIVDKPKKGDVMCVTRYTNESGTLLPADSQKVVWIDGLSINPKQLSQEFEPVGICVVVNGNKAMVRYRKEESKRWAAAGRLEIPYCDVMNDNIEYTERISLGYGEEHPEPFVFTSSSRYDFVNQLNDWFLSNDTNYSAELGELNTDLPAVDTSDNTDNKDNFYNRVIVNIYGDGVDFDFLYIVESPIAASTTYIKTKNFYYKNNMFRGREYGGCCRAKYYDYANTKAPNVSSVMTSIDEGYPVRLIDFTDNVKCKILRDNFSSYDEYIDSMMIKYPCGNGGAITEFPSGKENTYKLADCTFLNNITGAQETLYPAANYAASIDIKAPKLCKGNWWLPSIAEIAQIMRDITYDTTFWASNPDIVNIVLEKMVAFDSANWSMLSPYMSRWTSSRNDDTWFYFYRGMNIGDLGCNYKNYTAKVSPITIYEF